MNILLIEPDRIIGANYHSVLTKAGHTVNHVNSAEQAIIEADSNAFDIVILELLLQSHNGVEFLYEFRSYTEWQKVPIIILSRVPEEAMAPYRQALLQLGITKYLYKPHTKLASLVEMVERVEVV